MDLLKDLGVAGVLIMVAIIGWFLRHKDEQQGKAITLLFVKHDEDAKSLSDLRLEIAKEHYLKHELDARFLSLESTFKHGMSNLGDKFDRLSEILIGNSTNGNQRK